MRPAATTGIVLAGLVFFAAAAHFSAPLAVSDRPEDVVQDLSVEGPASDAGSEEAAPQTSLRDAAPPERNVAPGAVTVSPYAPRGLPDETKAAAANEPDAPENRQAARLFRPVGSAAGRIDAGGYRIAISGIHVTEPDAACKTADGGTWPCGMQARTAFRAWLRGRAVVCGFDPASASKAVTARCRVGDKDAGEWLVENGWTPAADGGPYADAGARAQKAGVGIYRQQ